jgi:hypothetical protein
LDCARVRSSVRVVSAAGTHAMMGRLNRQAVFGRRADREGPPGPGPSPGGDERAGHERCAGPTIPPDCRCHQHQERHAHQHRKRGRDGAGTTNATTRSHEQEGRSGALRSLSAGDLRARDFAARSRYDQRNDGDRDGTVEKSASPSSSIVGLSPAVQCDERRVEKDETDGACGWRRREKHGFAVPVQPSSPVCRRRTPAPTAPRPNYCMPTESSPAGCRLRAARRGARKVATKRRPVATRVRTRPASRMASGGPGVGTDVDSRVSAMPILPEVAQRDEQRGADRGFQRS